MLFSFSLPGDLIKLITQVTELHNKTCLWNVIFFLHVGNVCVICSPDYSVHSIFHMLDTIFSKLFHGRIFLHSHGWNPHSTSCRDTI